MANDFKKKEPTKTEKVLYELMMRQEMADRNLWTTSAHVIGLGMLLDIKPEQIAEMLVNGQEKVKVYGQQINQAIEKLEKERRQAQPDEHGHTHPHESGAEIETKKE
jgi:hypothetical protein